MEPIILTNDEQIDFIGKHPSNSTLGMKIESKNTGSTYYLRKNPNENYDMIVSSEEVLGQKSLHLFFHLCKIYSFGYLFKNTPIIVFLLIFKKDSKYYLAYNIATSNNCFFNEICTLNATKACFTDIQLGPEIGFEIRIKIETRPGTEFGIEYFDHNCGMILNKNTSNCIHNKIVTIRLDYYQFFSMVQAYYLPSTFSNKLSDVKIYEKIDS